MTKRVYPLSRILEPNEVVDVVLRILRIVAPREPPDVEQRSADTQSGDQWGTLERRFRIGGERRALDVCDSRTCIEMGVKGLGEARAVTVKTIGFTASIAVVSSSGPGEATILHVDVEAADEALVAAALDAARPEQPERA